MRRIIAIKDIILFFLFIRLKTKMDNNANIKKMQRNKLSSKLSKILIWPILNFDLQKYHLNSIFLHNIHTLLKLNNL